MRKLRLLYVLFMVLENIPDVMLESVESLGCWKDSQRKRALQSLENTHLFLQGNFRKRKDPIKRCAQVANDHGYLVFAIQNGGECLSGLGAERRFSMFGPSQNCKDGLGGMWSSNVYTYLPNDQRMRGNVLGTRRAKVLATMMRRIPHRQVWFGPHRPYRRGPLIPPMVMRTNAGMTGTRRNKLLVPFKLSQALHRQQVARVPHQALRRPIKPRNRIELLRTPNQALRGPLKPTIWTQFSRRPHQVLRGPIKPRSWTQLPHRPHEVLGGTIKLRLRAQVPRDPHQLFRGPIKPAIRTQAQHGPHKPLRGAPKIMRRTKANVLGTRRNTVMSILHHGALPHRPIPRNAIMLARRYRNKANVVGTRRNRVLPMMSKFQHRLLAHVPHQLFLRNPMLPRRFRTKVNVLGTRRNRVQPIVNSFPHRSSLLHAQHQSWRTPLVPARRSRPDSSPGVARSLHSAMDPTPWDPYCSRDLDIVVLMDGSGATSRRNKARWEEMKEFVVAFAKGYDDHGRIGIISYGEDSEIVCSLTKAYKADDIEERLKNLDMPGGRRGLNEALKTAWREQLKQNNRSSADKIIIAMTTGDLASGLYGSTQFLTDHNVRVIAVGIDKDPHYEFLQSIASYRDVSNVFSVNSENLLDAAPYMYRDVCNNVQVDSAKSNKRTVYSMKEIKTITARAKHALGMAIGIARNTKRFPVNALATHAVPLGMQGAHYDPNLRQSYLRHLPARGPFQRGVPGNRDAVNRIQAARNNLHRRVPLKFNVNMNRPRKPLINITRSLHLVKNAFPPLNIRHLPPITNQIPNVHRTLLARAKLARNNLREKLARNNLREKLARNNLREKLARNNLGPLHALNIVLSKQRKVRPHVQVDRFHQDHVKDFRPQGNINLHNARYTMHDSNNGRKGVNVARTGMLNKINHVATNRKEALLVSARKNKKDALNLKATPSAKDYESVKPPANGVQVIPDMEDIVISGKNVKTTPSPMNQEPPKKLYSKGKPLRRDGAPTIDGMKKESASGINVIPDDDDVVVAGKGVKPVSNHPVHNEEGDISKENATKASHLRRNTLKVGPKDDRVYEINVIHTGKETNYHVRMDNFKDIRDHEKSSAPLVDEDIQEQEYVTRHSMPLKETAPSKITESLHPKSLPDAEPSPFDKEILKTAAMPVFINKDELNNSFLGSNGENISSDKRTLHHKYHETNILVSKRNRKVANTSSTKSMPEYISETTPAPTKSTSPATTTAAPATTTSAKNTSDAKSSNKTSTSRNFVPKDNAPSNAEGIKHQEVISSFNGHTSDLSSEPTILLNPSPELPQKDKTGNVIDKPSAVDVDAENSTSMESSIKDDNRDDEDEDKLFEVKTVKTHKEKTHNNITKDDDDDENIRTFHDTNNSKSIEHSDHHNPTEENLSIFDEKLVQAHLGIMPVTSIGQEETDKNKSTAEKPLQRSGEASESEGASKNIKESSDEGSKLVNEVEEGEEGKRLIETHHATSDSRSTDTGVSRSEIYKASKLKETVGTTKTNIIEPLLVSNETKVESSKEGESTLNGVGALSQTIEYHVGGNSSMHVTNHTAPHGLNIHQSIFSGKLHDRISHFPSLKPLSMFRRPHDVFESKELNEQMVRSTLHYPKKKIYPHSLRNAVRNAGLELENLFSNTRKTIPGEKRTTIDDKGVLHIHSSAMDMPNQKMDHMGDQFGKYTDVELPDETDLNELQQQKVDKILHHFTGAKRNYNDFTTYTEVPYYRAIKRMYHSLLNHEGGLSSSLRPEQIRGISVIANQIKNNHVARDMKFQVSGSKRNGTEEGMTFSNDGDYLGDPKSATFPGTVTLGEGEFAEPLMAEPSPLGDPELLDPVIPQANDLNFDLKDMNKENIDTMRADMVEDDLPSPMSFAPPSKHNKHKKHHTESKEEDDDSITPESVKEQTRLTEPDETSNEEMNSTGEINEKLKEKDDNHDEKQVDEEKSTKLPTKQKSKTKASQQRDSAHDSITPDLIKEQTKLTEPQKPSFEEDNLKEEQPVKEKTEKGKNSHKGKKSAASRLKELQHMEKEFQTLTKENSTKEDTTNYKAKEDTTNYKAKEDTTNYKAKEIEELGKEYQSNEILLKNDENISSGVNEATSEEKKNNSGKSNIEIESENKVILTKILDLIHQIKPLHYFGDNMTAGKIEEIAFHNNLNSYFHNAFDNVDATKNNTEKNSTAQMTAQLKKESPETGNKTGNKKSSVHGCPVNTLCTDTMDEIGDEVLASFRERNQDNSDGTLGAQRDVVTGAKKGNIEYVSGDLEREEVSNFRESSSKKKNGIRVPDSPDVVPDMPHMSSLKPIGYIHPQLFRPAHSLAHPEHPPGFKSLFEHVNRKKTVTDDLTEIKDEMDKVSSRVSLMHASLTQGIENAMKKTMDDIDSVPLIHNFQSKIGRVQGGQSRTLNAASTKFFPKKKAIFYDELAPSKRKETKLNDTLENIYRAINQGNNEGFIHQLEDLAHQKKTPGAETENKITFGLNKFAGKGDNEVIMHQLEKLASQKKELKLDHALNMVKNNEDQSSDNGVIMNQLEKFAMHTKPPSNIFYDKSDQDDKSNDQTMIMQQLRKLAVQKKKSKFESGGDDRAMVSKYHVNTVLGNKKHTLMGKYDVAPRSPGKPALNSPVNENSVKNNVFDMMDLNDQDLSSLQPTAQSSLQASKKETMLIRKRPEHMGPHEVQYLKEDDFPRSFPYNSFSLSELPKLPLEKSYVISPPRAGNVMVSIRDNILSADNEPPHFVNEGADLSNDDLMARANHEINKVDNLAKSIEKLEKQDERFFAPPDVKKVHDGYISGNKDLHGFSPSTEPHTIPGLTNEIETMKVTHDETKEPTILAYNENAQKRNVTAKGAFDEVFPITQMLNTEQSPLPLSSLLPDKDEKLEMTGSEIVTNFRKNSDRHMFAETQKILSPLRGSPRQQISENSSSSTHSLVNEISDLLKGSLHDRSGKSEAAPNEAAPVGHNETSRNESANTNTPLNNKNTNNLTEVSGLDVNKKNASLTKENVTGHANEPISAGTNNETVKLNENMKNFLNESEVGRILPGTVFLENATKAVNRSSVHEPSKSNYTVNLGNSSIANDTYHTELSKTSYNKHPPKYKNKGIQNTLHNKGIGVSLSHLQGKSSSKDVSANDETEHSLVVKERTRPKITVIKIINIPNPNKASEDGPDEFNNNMRRNDTTPEVEAVAVAPSPNDPGPRANDTGSELETQDNDHGKANLMDNPTNASSSVKFVDAQMESKHKGKLTNDAFDLNASHFGAMVNDSSSLVDYNDIAPQQDNRLVGELSKDANKVVGEPSKDNSKFINELTKDNNKPVNEPSKDNSKFINELTKDNNKPVNEPSKDNNTPVNDISASGIKFVNESNPENAAIEFPNEEKSDANATVNEMQSQNLSHEIKSLSINETSSNQNETSPILPLQDYRNDSYKTNITSFKLLGNKDIQSTKNLLDSADSAGIFGKAQNASLDDLKKFDDFPFVRPTETNESLKTISSIHDKKDNFEFKPLNDHSTEHSTEQVSLQNETYAKHLVEIQNSRESPYNKEDKHLDDLKMVRDSPLNEEKLQYPKEVEASNFRSGTVTNIAHVLLQNPSPTNPKLKAGVMAGRHNISETQGETAANEQREPPGEHHEQLVDEHNEPVAGHKHLNPNPTPFNSKPNGEYHQVSVEAPQASAEFNVLNSEHHDVLTDHNGNGPQEVIAGYHGTTADNHKTLAEEHHEPSQEHPPPSPSPLQEESHTGREKVHSAEGNFSSVVTVSEEDYNKTAKEFQENMPSYNDTKASLSQNNSYKVNGSKEKFPKDSQKTFTEFIDSLNLTNTGEAGDNATAHAGAQKNESAGLVSSNLESNSTSGNSTNTTNDESNVTPKDILKDNTHDNDTAGAELKNITDIGAEQAPQQLTDYAAIFNNKSAPHIASSKEEADNVEFNNLEFAAGCSLPLRVVYAIDVSDGLGSGLERGKKWNKLNNFINKISKGFANGVTQSFMVYNVEPRFLKELTGCDEDTEYFTLADDCLCDVKSRVDNPNGCSVNAPLHSENIEDWGLKGPRTGLALKKVHDYFRTNHSLAKFKNLVILVSYQDSADDISEAERSLKRDGISLVNIDFGLHNSNLKRRDFINPAPIKTWGSRHITQNPVFRFKRNRIEDSIPKEHKFKVSFKSFRNSLGKIIKKVCKAEPGKRRSLIGNKNIRKSSIAMYRNNNDDDKLGYHFVV